MSKVSELLQSKSYWKGVIQTAIIPVLKARAADTEDTQIDDTVVAAAELLTEKLLD